MGVEAVGQSVPAADKGDADVIRVCRFLGLQALEGIPAPGAVTVDPHPSAPSLSFLVPAGTAVVHGGRLTPPPADPRSGYRCPWTARRCRPGRTG